MVLPRTCLRENDNLSRGIDRMSAVQSLLNNRTSRPPGVLQTLCVGQELKARQQHGLSEALILNVAGLFLVPGRIQHSDSAGHGSGYMVLDLTITNRDAIVNSVDVFHEVLVKLRVAYIKEFSGGRSSSQFITQNSLQHFTTKVLINQSSRRQFGLVTVQHSSKFSLVMVVSISFRVIDSAHIYYNITFLKNRKYEEEHAH